MRRQLVVGNWKMNLTVAPAIELTEHIQSHVSGIRASGPTVVLCPPFTALHAVRDSLTGAELALGAQDCHADRSGAHTGDVSAEMLADVGCRFVIVGHSERRRDHAESNLVVAGKAKAAIAAGLTPIVCVGETHAEHLEGRSHEVIQRQIIQFLDAVDADAARECVIAYEPIWAIGTGLAATPEYAQDIHVLIRRLLEQRGCADVPVLYGGSVTAGNAAQLFACPDIDGALVGGASLVASSFCLIIDALGSSRAESMR